MRLAALLAAMLVFAGPARSQGTPLDEARTAYDAGSSEYDLGHYKDALLLFEKAFRLKHVPALLFNIAQCHRMLGELKEAAMVYRSFISKDPGNRGVGQARELLAQVEQALEKSAQAQSAPPTGVTREAQAAAAEPLPVSSPALPAAPGPVLVVRADPPKPAAVPASSPPPSRASTPRPAPQAASQAPVPASAPGHRRLWTWVAAGGAAVALGIGAGFGARAKSTQSSLSGSLHPGAEVQGLQESQMSDAHKANALFIAGGVLGAATAALFVLEF